MKSELAGGKTFASPRLLRDASYAASVREKPAGGGPPRCPRGPPRPYPPGARPASRSGQGSPTLFSSVTRRICAPTRCEAGERPLDRRVKHALLRIGAVGLASSLTAVVLLGLGRLILIGDL